MHYRIESFPYDKHVKRGQDRQHNRILYTSTGSFENNDQFAHIEVKKVLSYFSNMYGFAVTFSELKVNLMIPETCSSCSRIQNKPQYNWYV